MRSALDAQAEPVATLRSMMDAYLGYAGDRPEGFRMLTAGLEREARVKAAPELVAEYDRRALACLNLLHEVIERGQMTGAFKPGDAWELTHAVWGACHGILAVAIGQRADRFVGFEVARLFERTADALLFGITS